MLPNTQARSFPTWRDAVDRLFESAFSAPLGTLPAQWSRNMVTWPVNVFEDDENYHVYALVPGANAEQLDITVQPGNYLTIAGTINPSFPQNAKAIWSEFGEMQFRRDVALPYPFDADKAQVSYHDGVLSLVLPKREEARPRQIKVLTNGK